MIGWLLSRGVTVLAVIGAVTLVGFATGVLSPQLGRPSPTRMIAGAVLATLALSYLLVTLLSGPGGITPISEELDPDQTIDLSLAPTERLMADWDAYADPRWPVLETLAEISQIAYESPVFAAQLFGELGLTDCYPLFDGSMVGYIAANDQAAVIVFRGTDFNEWSDWGVNKAVRPAWTEHGDIHSGFDNAYGGLQEQVVEVLRQLEPKRVWVTGHSLGGALATVCAYRLESAGEYPIAGLVTLGQPMVAKLDLAKHLDQLLDGRYVWVVNGKDVVPKTPPDYEPAGSLVHLDGPGQVGRWRRQAPVYATADADDGKRVEAIQGPPLEPLTPEEKKALQLRLKEEPPPAFDDTPKAYAMSMPEVDHHLMDAYREAVRSLLGASSSE